MARTLVIGTRGSRLALRQVGIVVDALNRAHPGATFEVREIRTEGDRSSAPLSVIGGAGVFTRTIEDALLRGEVDIAVHSLKDLPPDIAPGLALAAIPERGDPRDALVSRDNLRLDDLPQGARVGTGSARRSVQLKMRRPDVDAVEIRGNVDTRIRKADEGEFDAVVLAMAGLERLGLSERAAQVFGPDEMVPAVGQAALAVEVRSDDEEAIALAAAIDHAPTRAAVRAERAFLGRLGAGCRLPVGAHVRIEGDTASIVAMIADQSGRPHRHTLRVAAVQAEQAAVDLAQRFLDSVAASSEVQP